MKNQDILVVTATLGDRKSLEKTIDSVSKIGKSRVFHVIIAPEAKCNYLENKFPNVKIIPEDKSCKGIYPALNHALKKYASEFKYLTFINDDDYWLENYIKLIEVLDKNSTVDVVYGKVSYVNEYDFVIGEQTCSPRYKSFGVLLLKDIVLFTQQATLMRSDVFITLGGFDENFKLISDTKFWLQAISNNYSFCYINSICAAYMIQEGQLSSDNNRQRIEHGELIKEIKNNNKFNCLVEVLLFRLYNLNIYINRLLKNKKVVTMGQLFHE